MLQNQKGLLGCATSTLVSSTLEIINEQTEASNSNFYNSIDIKKHHCYSKKENMNISKLTAWDVFPWYELIFLHSIIFKKKKNQKPVRKMTKPLPHPKGFEHLTNT